jgi:hypothetical protein
MKNQEHSTMNNNSGYHADNIQRHNHPCKFIGYADNIQRHNHPSSMVMLIIFKGITIQVQWLC